MSGLVTSEIFRLCLNTLTPDDKHSRRNMQTFWQKFKRFYLRKERLVLDFLLNFLNVQEI